MESNKEQEVFDELFNDSGDEYEEEKAQLKSDSSSSSEEEEEQEYSQSDSESRPKNRPKLIPTGSQSDDKIMEARRDFDEALAKMKPTRRRANPTDSQDVVKAGIYDKEN